MAKTLDDRPNAAERTAASSGMGDRGASSKTAIPAAGAGPRETSTAMPKAQTALESARESSTSSPQKQAANGAALNESTTAIPRAKPAHPADEQAAQQPQAHSTAPDSGAETPATMAKAGSAGGAAGASGAKPKAGRTAAMTAGATVAGAQIATPIMLLMQLLSMVQASIATAVSWVGGVIAAVQGLGAVAASALSAGLVGALALGVIGIGVLTEPTDDGGGMYCGNRLDVRAALGLTKASESDETMVGNAKVVWAVMSGWGMPDENIAGILGNWEDESRITAAVVQGWKPLSEATDSSNGIGLGQWTGSRNTSLRSFAEKRRTEWSTIETQLAFMVQGDEQMYVDVVKKMVKTSLGTPGNASAYYRAEWERNKAGTASDPSRSSNSEKWFALMQGWGSPTQYLSGGLAALAKPLKGLLGDAADAISGVANTVAGWLGMNCPSVLGTGADGDIPLWNGAAAPPFANEPGSGTKPNAILGARVAHMYFGKFISGYGGYSDRGSECSYSDHCKGLAVDFMIQDWDTSEGNAHGWQVARFFQQNAKALNVSYIIFNKQKWNVSGDAADLAPESWRTYNTPRGNHNPTNDHYDHVHVSFKA